LGNVKRLVTIGIAGLALALTLTFSGVFAGTREYGTEGYRPRPDCPKPTNCQVLSRVTGIQLAQAKDPEGKTKGAFKYPYRAVRDGKLVGFSVTLSKPTSRQRSYFNKQFGGQPSVRIAVLKPDTRGKGARVNHRLIAQSELFHVNPYLGSKPTFALSKSLVVKKGWQIGLTVPTWAPAFAVGLSTKEAWRGSRRKGTCDNAGQRAAHQRRDSVKPYACLYRTARLAYTAIVISDNRRTDGR
jgi:hypothetical protein